ncbi:MAG: SUF system Fe-S cluster assembly protein [Thiobacillaceae bacterium]
MTVDPRKLAQSHASNAFDLRNTVIEALKTVYDPEIPVNIYDLGLVYELRVDGAGKVDIEMTLTAPGCPVAQTFPSTVEERVRAVPGVSGAYVEIVWDPPWEKGRMSELARIELGLF